VPSECYEFTLCDEHTRQIRCIACHHSSTGTLHLATGGQELKLWTQSTTNSSQLMYAMHCFFESLTSVNIGFVHLTFFAVYYNIYSFTNSLTIGYIWRVTKYCIVLYCIVLYMVGLCHITSTVNGNKEVNKNDESI